MTEKPLVAAVKIALLVLIAFLLVFHFVSINQTQEKVIETAGRVAALGEEIADLEREIRRGMLVPGPDRGAAPARLAADLDHYAEAGWRDLLSPEPERFRPPDDQIDFAHELRYQLPVEPRGLNIYTSDRDRYVSVDLGFYTYAPLAERKNSDRNAWKPGLAIRVLQNPDHRTFVIRLREGVLWQRPAVDLTDPRYAWMTERHEVTAEDLAYALDMIRDERADTDGVRSSFDEVESYEAVDAHTFRITWERPNFYSVATTLSDLQPLPKWIYTREEDGTPIDEASWGPRFAAHWFNKNMCGYGAYHFDEYKTGDYIRLRRNEDYWGRRPAFASILYKLKIRDDQPRYNMFMHRDDGGERDQHTYPISSTRWKRDVIDNDGSSPLRQQLAAKQLCIYSYPRMMYAYTGWACRSVFFNDARVRRAMTMASNREAWRKDILYNTAVFPSGIAFVQSPEYDDTVAPWPYDLEEAARLLDEAGWKDRDGNGVREKEVDGEIVEFRFKVSQTPGSPEIDSMRSDWEQSLRKIGVVMEADIMEWNTFLGKVKNREFTGASLAWFLGDEFDPESLFHSSQIDVLGSQNYVAWSHPRSDEIIDALKTTFDIEKRIELAHEYHRLFHEHQPYTLGWSWRNPIAHDAHIGGIVARNFSPQVDWRDAWWQKDGPARYDDERDEVPTLQ